MDSDKIKTDSDASMDVLLENIKELVVELHPSWPKTRKILPDSLLSKDLGMDSLARVELLMRMERSFGTTFEEKIFIDAETPRDLWQAIIKTGSSLASCTPMEMKAPAMTETYDLPHSAKTLVDVLNWHIDNHPERPHIRSFLLKAPSTRIPGLRPFHLGAFEAAVEADVPVVPNAIQGTRSMLRDVSLFPRRGKIKVTMGKPIEPRFVKDSSAPDAWATAIKLRDAAREHILQHCGEPDLAAN